MKQRNLNKMVFSRVTIFAGLLVVGTIYFARAQANQLSRDPSRDSECQRIYSGTRYKGISYGWFQYSYQDGGRTYTVDKGCQPITCPAGSSRDPVQAVCICDSNTENAGRPIEGSGSEAVGKPKPGIGPVRSVLSCSSAQGVQPTEKPKPVSEPEKTDQRGSAESQTLSPTPDEEVKDVLPFIPSERVKQFRQLVQRYRETIPKGFRYFNTDEVPPEYRDLHRAVFGGATPGEFNNLIGSNETACGGYQDKVLKWLLSLHFSKNPSDKTLIEGFDFGPIQIEKGAHQAVVIYPRGTNWRSNGIVLDPWREQEPRLYTIGEWDSLYYLSPEPSVGNIITPIDANVGNFPTTPDDKGKWKYTDVYNPKPVVRNRIAGGRRIAVRSPVNVLVSDDSGKLFGLREDGTFVNDFDSDVEGYVFKTPDGGYQTGVNLPDGAYEVKMTAINSGDIHVYAAAEKDVIGFESVSVSKGDKLSLNWNKEDALPQMFDSKNQEVASQLLTKLQPSVKYIPVILVAVIAGIAVFFLRQRIRFFLRSFPNLKNN